MLQLNGSTYTPLERSAYSRIVECINLPKNSDRLTEDRIVCGEYCIAVLDGVSQGADTNRILGLTPGAYAVRSGAETFLSLSREFKVNPHTLAHTLARELSERLARDAPSYRGFLPSFVFAAYFPREKLIVRVGDCSIRFAGELVSDTVARNPLLKVDLVRADCRSYGKDPGRAWQLTHENNATSPLGYGCITPRSLVPATLVDIFHVDSHRSIVLASDGYPPHALRDTLHATEAHYTFFKASEKSSLHLDDRTYVRVE